MMPRVYTLRSLSNLKSSRLKVPFSRFDLSMIGDVRRDILVFDEPVEVRA